VPRSRSTPTFNRNLNKQRCLLQPIPRLVITGYLLSMVILAHPGGVGGETVSLDDSQPPVLAAHCAFVAWPIKNVRLYATSLLPFTLDYYEMANPIVVNPASAARRLTIGGSDWLWVVFTIMILSAVAVFVWSKLVGLFPWFSARRVFHRDSPPKATSRNASVSLSRCSYPHGVIVIILRHGIQLGADGRQNRIQARGNA